MCQNVFLDSLEFYLTRQDERFEFLQDEIIIIRMESMKSEIDKLQSSLQERALKVKKEYDFEVFLFIKE